MSLKRAFAFLLLLASLSCFAATTANRSPFTQGLWWNPDRSGNGFDIFNVGTEVMLLWYTFDAQGRPMWYSAQGALQGSSTGTLSLMESRWLDGRQAPASAVGSIRLDLANPERISAAWSIGPAQGTWSLRPFTQSGVINEVDHSGTWYDPRNPGWGLSFLEQGDITGSVVFTYDANGRPTWFAGFGRDGSSVEMFTADGACPSCTYRASVAKSVGRLRFELGAEWSMTLRNEMSASMAAGVTLEGAPMLQLSRSASMREADRQLASFASAAALRQYLVAGMANTAYYAYSCVQACFSAAPPAAASTFSSTNLQEAGVDESDLVKTDGTYIYTYAYESGMAKPVVRIARVGNDGGTVDVRGSYALAAGTPAALQKVGLFLHAGNLVSIAGSSGNQYWLASSAWTNGATYVEVMSLANPEAPATRWTAQIDGHNVASRRIGDRLYLVTRFVPAVTPAQAADAPLSQLTPNIRVNGGAPASLVDPASIYVPPLGERGPVADLLVVTAIDLTGPRVAQTLAVTGSIETLYASLDNLFIATAKTLYRSPGQSLLPIEPPTVLTEIHQVRLGANAMSVVGSGTVEGQLGADIDKAAFRLSEYNGKLRVVSSSSNWWMNTRNRVTVLEPSQTAAGLLKTVSYLPNAARPQSLGKPGELLYATRFSGDRLYAVTFKMVDPLYIVDLSVPADPEIAGALELPGFAEYLHPLPNGLLLGFGKDARPATSVGDGTFSWYQGLQLTLFDVSNANQPRQLQTVLMGKRGSGSALLNQHHAFSALNQSTGVMSLAFPARLHDGSPPFVPSDSYTYPWQESGLLRFELRGSTPADARLVQLPSLVTHTRSTAPTLEYSTMLDAALTTGRSVLFRSGTVYVGNGQFWAGGTPSASASFAGPF
jgi:uncharacterized secreted protein with C-terminal beta-propeller domain